MTFAVGPSQPDPATRSRTRQTAYRGSLRGGRLVEVRGDGAAYRHVMSEGDNRDSGPARAVDGGTTVDTDVDKRIQAGPVGQRTIARAFPYRSVNARWRWKPHCSRSLPATLALCRGGDQVILGRRACQGNPYSEHHNDGHHKDHNPQHEKSVGLGTGSEQGGGQAHQGSLWRRCPAMSAALRRPRRRLSVRRTHRPGFARRAPSNASMTRRISR